MNAKFWRRHTKGKFMGSIFNDGFIYLANKGIDVTEGVNIFIKSMEQGGFFIFRKNGEFIYEIKNKRKEVIAKFKQSDKDILKLNYYYMRSLAAALLIARQLSLPRLLRSSISSCKGTFLDEK